MYCSTCAAEISVDQQDCRSCGSSLTTGVSEGRSNFRYLMLAAMCACFLGIFVSITGRTVDVKWLSFVGVFVALAGLLGMIAVALMRESRPKRRRSPQPSFEPQALSAKTTSKLPPIPASDLIPSVTEGTTELLTGPNKIIGA